MKHDASGRSKGGRFTRLDHSILSSPAYRSLSPNARSLLVELAMMENGRNNGELFLSVRDAADRLGVADLTAATNAFDELETAGLIACTRTAHFAVKAGVGSRARCWRLTWQSTPCLKIGPSSEFRTYEPKAGSRANKRAAAGCRALKRYTKAQSSGNLPVVDSATLKPERVADSNTTPTDKGGLSVLDSATRLEGNGGKPSLRIVRDSATHTATQLVEGSGEPSAAGHSKAKAAGGDRATYRDCEHCSDPFELTRSDRAYARRFCSEQCRKAAERERYQRRKAGEDEAQKIGRLIDGVLAKAAGQ